MWTEWPLCWPHNPEDAIESVKPTGLSRDYISECFQEKHKLDQKRILLQSFLYFRATVIMHSRFVQHPGFNCPNVKCHDDVRLSFLRFFLIFGEFSLVFAFTFAYEYLYLVNTSVTAESGGTLLSDRTLPKHQHPSSDRSSASSRPPLSKKNNCAKNINQLHVSLKEFFESFLK